MSRLRSSRSKFRSGAVGRSLTSLFAVSALVLLASSAPLVAHAQPVDLALRARFAADQGGDEIRAGTAELQVRDQLSLALHLDGVSAEPMKGIPVFGGYLFTGQAAEVSPVSSKHGLASAMNTVFDVSTLEQVRAVEVVVAAVRVREAPNTEAEQVGVLRRSDQVEVLEEREGWVKVSFAGSREGWCFLGDENPALSARSLPRLDHVPAARSVFLHRRGRGWEGRIQDGEELVATLALRRARTPAPGNRRRVLVLPDSRSRKDGLAFVAYALRIREAYRQRGFTTVIPDIDSWEDVIDELEAAQGAPYKRVIFIGHGGWDGPIYRSHAGTRQVSGGFHKDVYARLVNAVRVGTSKRARILNSSCHAAGTAQAEQTDVVSDYRWVLDLARRTGRVVAGPAGRTSTEWTLRHAFLEGQGTVVQEFHVARGHQARVLFAGQSLAVALPATLAYEGLPLPSRLGTSGTARNE